MLTFIFFIARGNVSVVDSLFFGASACTESGLNTIDVMDLDVYQQIMIYFMAIITNLGFVSIIVVVIRLYWFKKRLNQMAKSKRVNGDEIPTPSHKEKNANAGVDPAARKEESTAQTGEQSTEDAEHIMKRREERRKLMKRTTKIIQQQRTDSHPKRRAKERGYSFDMVQNNYGNEEVEEDREDRGAFSLRETAGAHPQPNNSYFALDIRERNSPHKVLVIPGPRERRDGTLCPLSLVLQLLALNN
jgi:hypothetical protein